MDSEGWRHVALCIVRDGDRVLLCEAVDRVNGEAFLRPPGGGIEPGESPQEGLVREVEEELGCGLLNVRALCGIRNEFVFEGQPGRELVYVFEADLDDRSLYQRDQVPLFEAGWQEARWVSMASLRQGGPPLFPAGLLSALE